MAQVKYRVRISSRARSVRLQITPEEGLLVVIPAGFDAGRLPGLIERRRGWIERHLKRLGAPRPALEAGFLPERIELDALGEDWAVRCEPGGAHYSLTAQSARSTLLISGPAPDQARVLECLRGWLRLRAQQALEPWARELGGQLGLHPANIRIRNQKRRWGSCNARYDLSLNLKLLFLSPEQVRYVLVHELCHIRHRDHSPPFWDLVRRHQADYESLNGSLRDAWRRVPAWV